MPSWLRGNTPGELGQLAHAGATLQVQKARLAQQARQEQAQMAMHADQIAQSRAQEQAQLETEKAYRQIQTTLKQRQLDQASQMIQARTQAAAQKFQAQQEYQRAIESGMDPERAILEFGPAMGQSASSVAIAMNKGNRGATIPASIVDEQHAGQDFVKVTQPNGRTTLQQVHKPTPRREGLTDYQKYQLLKGLTNQRMSIAKSMGFAVGQTDLPKDASEGTKARFQQFQNEMSKIDRQIEALQSGQPSVTSGTGTNSAKRFRYDPKTGTLEPVGEQADQSQEPPEEE